MKSLMISKGNIRELCFEKAEEQFKPLLKKAARKWRCFGEDDIYQISRVGLWKAFKNYSLERNVCFGHYASTIINREILLYIRDTSQNFENDTLSLNVILTNGDDKDVEVIDNIQYEGFEEELLEKIYLEDLIDKLPNDEKKIIKKFFYEDETQTNIGKLMNFSQSYINQKIASGIKHLHKEYKKLFS